MEMKWFEICTIKFSLNNIKFLPVCSLDEDSDFYSWGRPSNSAMGALSLLLASITNAYEITQQIIFRYYKRYL